MTQLPTNIQMCILTESMSGDVSEVEFASTTSEREPDPYVRQRIAPLDATASSELITEFGPAPTRPVTYLEQLPFIPGRAVYTTESPDAYSKNGARWPCSDPAILFAEVIQASIADGWQVVRHEHEERHAAELQRGDMMREVEVVFVHCTAFGSVVNHRFAEPSESEAAPRGIACPKCGVVPVPGPWWTCAPDGCGEGFDTFATGARCPQCTAQFTWTACPSCARVSAHAAWYRNAG